MQELQPQPALALRVEAGLLQAARRGDLGAYNRLILQHQDLAFNLAFHLLGNEDWASEALQDACLTVYGQLGTTRLGESFRVWLLRAVAIASQEIVSRRARHSNRPVSQPEGVYGLGEDPHAWQIAYWSLSPELRAPLLLVDQEGLSYAETASILGKPVSAIQDLLARGRMCLAASHSQP